MEVKNLTDAELLNAALLISDMQELLITEIRDRPLMGKVLPVVMHMDVANKASRKVNEFILQAFKFDMACSFGETSDKIVNKILDIINSYKNG